MVELLSDGRRMLLVAVILLVVAAALNAFSGDLALLFTGDTGWRVVGVLNVIALGLLRPAGIACLVVGLLRFK